MSLKELLKALHIHYITKNWQQQIAAGSIQLIHSNNTFAHIYSPELLAILNTFRELADPEKSTLSHHIDLCDHFAHVDPAISIFHFLKYSDRQWKKIDNSLQAQSRNRLSDYRRLYGQAGIPITSEHTTKVPEESLRGIVLNERFRAEDRDDLLVTHVQLVSKF